MVVGSWDKEGIINMVDGQLKRPQDGTSVDPIGSPCTNYPLTRQRPSSRWSVRNTAYGNLILLIWLAKSLSITDGRNMAG